MLRKYHRLLLLACFTVSSGIALGQSEQEGDGTLSNSSDVNIFYAKKHNLQSRQNAEKLTAIDKEYGDRVAALGAENARRLQAIFAENLAAHKGLAGKDLSTDEHNAEYQRIESAKSKARAELSSWYDSEQRAASEAHRTKRAEQIANHQSIVVQLNEQQKTALQMVLNAPVAVVTLDRVPTSSDDTQTPLPSVAGAGSEGMLGNEQDQLPVPPGIEPAPASEYEAPPEPVECVWGECPNYAAWGEEPPHMQCKEFNSGDYEALLFRHMSDRLRGTRVRINADPAAGEMSFIEVGGERSWDSIAPAPTLKHTWTRILTDRRDKEYLFHDINSTHVRVGSERPRLATAPYVLQVDFESDRSELKGWCPNCRSWRRDSAARDSHFGTGSKSNRPWSWTYEFALRSEFSANGTANIFFDLQAIRPQVLSQTDTPTWDMRDVRADMKQFATQTMSELQTYIGTVIASRAFGRLAAETLTEMTGIPRDRLYYIAQTQPEWERDSQNDIWRACYRP